MRPQLLRRGSRLERLSSPQHPPRPSAPWLPGRHRWRNACAPPPPCARAGSVLPQARADAPATPQHQDIGGPSPQARRTASPSARHPTRRIVPQPWRAALLACRLVRSGQRGSGCSRRSRSRGSPRTPARFRSRARATFPGAGLRQRPRLRELHCARQSLATRGGTQSPWRTPHPASTERRTPRNSTTAKPRQPCRLGDVA